MRHTWSQDCERLGAHPSCAHDGTDWYNRQKPGEATDGGWEGSRAGRAPLTAPPSLPQGGGSWSSSSQQHRALKQPARLCWCSWAPVNSYWPSWDWGPRALRNRRCTSRYGPGSGWESGGMPQAQCLVFVPRRCVRGLWHVPGTWRGFCRLARGWQSFSLVSGPQPRHSVGQPPQARSAEGSYFGAHQKACL